MIRDPYIGVDQRQMNEQRDLLVRVMQGYDIDITDETATRLLEYLDLMLKKNNEMNLTAIRDFNKGVILHIVDSLLYYKSIMKFASLADLYYPTADEVAEVEEDSVISFLDMGCGAGLPGIPLTIIEPSLHGVLCDSTKKKIAAVQSMVEDLYLSGQLTTCAERVEQLPMRFVDGFSVVTARAMGTLPVLLEYASPLLFEDGIFVVSKGNPPADEMKSASKVARLVGMELLDSTEYQLPGDMGHRVILTYGKVDEPRVELPRPVGMASSHPLA